MRSHRENRKGTTTAPRTSCFTLPAIKRALQPPPVGADVYLLKSILHDWDDERARELEAKRSKSDGEDPIILGDSPVFREIVALYIDRYAKRNNKGPSR